MYAGSTVITLTLIWGIRIILSTYKLKERSSDETDHQQDSTKNCSSLKDKLPLFETDKDFYIDKKTRDMAANMLCSLIPFVFLGLLHFINTRAMTLFALIVSFVTLLLYFYYQVENSWIRYMSLLYLNQENLRTRFFYHVVWLADFEDLRDFGVTYFERIFKDADTNPDGKITTEKNNASLPAYFIKFVRFCRGRCQSEANVDNNKAKHISHNVDNNKDQDISQDELGKLVQQMFVLEEKEEKSKNAVLIHFDTNKDGKINWEEFKRGCKNWLQEAINSGSVFETIWNQAVARSKQRPDIRINLKQVLERHGLVKDGKPDTEKIKGLFSQHDKDGNHVIHRDDFKKLIVIVFGKALDRDKLVLGEFVKEFYDDKNQSEEKEEFVDRFIKWIEKAIDPQKEIKDFEEDWAAIQALLKREKPKATIVYAIFGIAITIIITSPFIASVKQFSTAAHIPFLFTSFVIAPIAMKAKMVIVGLLNIQNHVRKNASLTFSEIYNQLVMDNLIGFVSLLSVVYIRGLSWTYTAEVLAIIIPCATVGVFAIIKRDTYPLWASISAILLYPVSVYIYYVLPNAS